MRAATTHPKWSPRKVIGKEARNPAGQRAERDRCDRQPHKQTSARTSRSNLGADDRSAAQKDPKLVSASMTPIYEDYPW